MARLSDFFFIGSAILPVFLWLNEEPILAAWISVVLMLAGAVCSIDDPEAPWRVDNPAGAHPDRRRQRDPRAGPD